MQAIGMQKRQRQTGKGREKENGAEDIPEITATSFPK